MDKKALYFFGGGLIAAGLFLLFRQGNDWFTQWYPVLLGGGAALGGFMVGVARER